MHKQPTISVYSRIVPFTNLQLFLRDTKQVHTEHQQLVQKQLLPGYPLGTSLATSAKKTKLRLVCLATQIHISLAVFGLSGNGGTQILRPSI